MSADTDYLYAYPPLLAGTLRQRYKRFFADIELESGEVVTAHCPNTGPMTGVCAIGAPVLLSRSDNPKRKLAYTWEAIQVCDPDPTWVGVNTSLPNRIVKAALTQKIFPELRDRYATFRTEVPYGRQKSRIDFLLESSEGLPIYLEVKNTTWTDATRALFPDTVTTRGQKHLQELMDVLPAARAAIVYFINRGDRKAFAPGDTKDPVYGQLLREALAAGVEVLPYCFSVDPGGVRFLGRAELDFC